MEEQKKKIAVVLFNLGGPDSKDAIKPFLMNFFMDRNIIALPKPFRFILALMIARRRSKKEAGESYGELGGSSPLLMNSELQAKALNSVLSQQDCDKFKVFVSMRYWHPMADQVVRDVHAWGADCVVLLPLYPQFSTTTSWSSLEAWNKAAKALEYHCNTSMVCCYPFNEGFIRSSVEQISMVYDQALKDGHDAPRVLFSAHGLPEDIVKKGDPYQWQCEQSAQKIAEALQVKYGLDALDWKICYQSRVGPKKWIGPSLDEELKCAAHDGKAVVIYPHAFTQEHVETLVELDIEYKELAETLGIDGYYRAQTVSTHPDFIAGLADLVKAHVGRTGIYAEGMKTICPDHYDRCCMRKEL